MSIFDSLKEAIQKAEQLAQNKQLREAVTTVETALNLWAENANLWERLFGKLLIRDFVETLEKKLAEWRKEVAKADQLIAQAQVMLKNDTGDPFETQALISAIAFYRLSTHIISDDSISKLIEECQQVLQKKQQFQRLVKKAKLQAENRFFQKAIAIYQQADILYPTEKIKKAISDVQAQVTQEETYNYALQKVQKAESEGRLRGAITILDSALDDFPRNDGFYLLQKLKSKLKGRTIFHQGLVAEKAGDFSSAKSFYESAKSFLPDPKDCQIRLGLVAIKMQDWENALSHLQGLSGEQAVYLRGFVLAQQGNLQSAYREWQEISVPSVIQQREAIKRISQRQRLEYLQKIEELVKTENIAAAKTASREFIEKFGADPLVSANLWEHIQPRLEAAIWKNSDWENIVNQTQKLWLANTNITTLHNWTVAIYYYAQNHPEVLFDLIISLATSLANLSADCSLRNIPWLEDKDVNFHAVSLELKRRLEAAIDHVKNINIEDYLAFYLDLRDRYRWELVALRYMGEPATSGMQVNDLFITPGCYFRFRANWQNNIVENIHPHQKILRSLYTPWGLSVAACLEEDSQRAIQIKPSTSPNSEIEKFAQNFVAYHEGCYQLKQQTWRKAIIPLQSIKTEIKNCQDWQQEIERLCGLQRQVILEFPEHLEFAEFWYAILAQSKSAKSYFVEYKAEEVRQQIVNEQISLNQALEKLQELKKIDSSNTIVIDMMENVELSQEIKEINQLFQHRQYEKMLSKAKLSPRDRVRYIVAEFFLDTLIKGIQEGRLHDPKIMLQLGSWAYEICPHEPKFQEIYRQLNLC